MAGTKYYVDIVYRTSGDPAGGAEKLGEKARKAAHGSSDAWSDASKVMLAGFTGVVEKLGAVAISLGEAGVAAGIGAVSYGVVGLNKELETTQVSLAAVLNANHQSTGGIEGALQASAKWVRQMKIDARELPGEFEELLQIVQTGSGAAFKLGLDPMRFERLASSAMAAGKALAVPLDQAGRELAQLMEGRAGMHNVFGVRLGIDAHALYEDVDKVKKTFHDLSKEGRIKILEEKIGAFTPAIKAFADTYDAQSSTLIDNAKSLLQLGTQELFGRVVNDLKDVNRWFDENRGNLEAWAREVGHDLVTLHDRVRKVAEEWMPVLKEFGQNAYKKFAELWRDAEPYVRSIADHIKDFLKDKESIEKLTTLLKLYIAAKVGGAIAGSTPFQMLQQAAMTPGGFQGAGAAAAGGGATLAAAAGVGLAWWQWEELQKDRARMAAEEWGNFQDYARILSEQSKDLSNRFGEINLAGQAYQEELTRITQNSGEAAGALYSFAVALQNADADLQKLKKDKADSTYQDIVDQSRSWANQMAQSFLAGKTMEDEAAKKRKKDTEGKMVLNGNIYFTITSNQNPGQIAREVQTKLIEKRRFPTSSPHTRNFGVARSG